MSDLIMSDPKITKIVIGRQTRGNRIPKGLSFCLSLLILSVTDIDDNDGLLDYRRKFSYFYKKFHQNFIKISLRSSVLNEFPLWRTNGGPSKNPDINTQPVAKNE